MTPHVAALMVAAGCAAGGAPALSAQQGSPVSPVALPALTQQPTGTASDVLHRPITLHLRHVRLSEALGAIAEAAHLALSYDPNWLPLDAVVSLDANAMPAGDAFRAVLRGMSAEPVAAKGGTRVALQPVEVGQPLSLDAQGTATITGHVIDAALKTPLSDVAVRIEGTTRGTTAGADGKYTITGVAPGTYRVTARRVGYQPLSKDVTVTADQPATLDFALAAAPTRLDEIVTTAVGQQRRYEVGNDISTINADSIAPTAPITSLTDLISARAPGVSVLETSGMTGSGEAIRIEGLTSLVLQNDPILIVDGVREDNSAGGDVSVVLGFNGGNGGTHPTPTRLNDLDFSDIATIDILKGPAASTEYGTDAANGVIVITTKHGTAGKPQWKASAEQTASDIPESFPNGYYSWGHATNGTNTPVDCTVSPTLSGFSSVAGSCVVDSVTRWNPLNHAATSIFGTGYRSKYDLSVSGGSEAARYFISGGVSNETGLIHMPSVFRQLADSVDLGEPASALNPNSEQQRSVRVNTAIRLGPTVDLSATGSYLSTYQQTPNSEVLYEGVFFAPALRAPADYYGYGFFNGATPILTPLSQLTQAGSQNTDRVTGGLTATWRPTPWFVGHGTAGLDHGSQLNEELTYPLANTAYENSPPALGLGSVTTDVYSVDLRGSATAALARTMRAVTSGGLQMVDTRFAGQTGWAQNITSTNLTLNGATGPTVTQLGTRQATLGGYAEEQMSVADRLFVTGALRIDAASGFGHAYKVADYPKASVSWLALNQGPTTVRIRGAYGQSGVQPTNGAAQQLYRPAIASLGGGGSPIPAAALNWPGNPNLEPERSAEFEGGVDVGGWRDRLSIALTGYSKTTHDALVNVNLGGTFDNLPYQENIGQVRNTGLEGSVTAGLVRTQSIVWDVAINASVNHNVLLSLAPGVTAQPVFGSVAQYRQAVGYPLYGIWAQPVTYADVNRDGVIEPREITIGDSVRYVGPSLPTQEVSVSTHFALLRGAVAIGGLADYRGGYKIVNAVPTAADFEGNTLGTNDPMAPLRLQARAMANNQGSNSALNDEDGSFIRVREVSVTYAAPRSLLRALRLESLSVTAAVRNLALWTRYSGVDPEVSNGNAGNVQYTPTTAGFTLNNDERADYGAVPLARYWVVRLNVGN